MEEHPCDAEGEQAGVAGRVVEYGEMGLCGDAVGPAGGQKGRDGGDAAVLGEVRQLAALGDSAKELRVFAVGGDVVGVEGEEGVVGGVVAGVEEGLLPGVARGEPGEFDVGVGGVEAALDEEHGDGERDEGEGGNREAEWVRPAVPINGLGF